MNIRPQFPGGFAGLIEYVLEVALTPGSSPKMTESVISIIKPVGASILSCGQKELLLLDSEFGSCVLQSLDRTRSAKMAFSR